MLVDFFFALKDGKVPVSVREFLHLMSDLKGDMVYAGVDQFFTLSRTVLVKDEKFYDKFDRAFAKYFEGIEDISDEFLMDFIPEEWLQQKLEKGIRPEQLEGMSREEIERLVDNYQKKLEEAGKGKDKEAKTGSGDEEQKEGEGGKKKGLRVGKKGAQKGRGQKKQGSKVWENRQYKNLDDNIELGTRNIKMALRRLRKFTRQGPQDLLDIDDTISSTAKNAGLLDVKLVAERRNAVKVLIFFDVGGSMDPYIRICEELFSAARTEFKHMEYFYFHNFIYEAVWKDNMRRWDQRTPTWDIIRTYSSDYKVIFVGDATMSPYEISSEGGSVEHWNEEPGQAWMTRITDHFSKVVWINPEPENSWNYATSTVWIKRLLENQMYPMTLKGLEDSMKQLAK